MNKEHDHGATSNSRGAVSTFIGCRVKGVLTGVQERGSSHRSAFTIVFDCGWGLTVLHNGSYYVVKPETITDHLSELNEALILGGGKP